MNDVRPLLPSQPVTQKGDLASPALLELLQGVVRNKGKTDENIAGKAPMVHSHVIDDVTDVSAVGKAMVTAADAAAQTALLNAFTSALKGLVPASGGGTDKFLRADGQWSGVFEYGQLSADFILTSTTDPQRLFNWSTNGALTLSAGVYRFRSIIYLTGMSATSGNAAFHLLGAGTATVSRVLYQVSGIDATSPLGTGARVGSGSVTQASGANMMTAAVGAGMLAEIGGMFEIGAGGTLIPSIALGTAAAAAVKAGSFFECQRLGSSAVSAGWS